MLILLYLFLLAKLSSHWVMWNISSAECIKWDINLGPFSCSNNILDEKCRFDQAVEIDANPCQFQDFIKFEVAKDMLDDENSSELFEENHSFCIHSYPLLNESLLLLDKKFLETRHGFVSLILKPLDPCLSLHEFFLLFINHKLFIEILQTGDDRFNVGIF